MSESSQGSRLKMWPPPGSYPGDRVYRVWFVFGALALVAAASLVSLGWFSRLLLALAAISALSAAVAGVINARSARFNLWKRLVSERDDSTLVRSLEVGSRDGIATAVLVSQIRAVDATVAVTSPNMHHLVTANVAAARASDVVAVVECPIDRFPADDSSIDVVMADSAEQLVKGRARFGRVTDEIVRVAAPGASVFVVTGGRTRSLRKALIDAGASDARIEGAFLWWWTGYRLVRATFPGDSEL